MESAYIISGLLVGFLVGLTGVGGGSLMTPLLVFLFGFAPTTAVGTDLLFAAITKAGGVLVHHGKHRSVEWKIVFQLGLGSIPAAILVIYLLENVIKHDAAVTTLITTTLGIALILTALSLLLRNRLSRKSAVQRMSHTERFGRWQGVLTILVGLVLGGGGDAFFGRRGGAGHSGFAFSLSSAGDGPDSRYGPRSRDSPDSGGWPRPSPHGQCRFQLADESVGRFAAGYLYGKPFERENSGILVAPDSRFAPPADRFEIRLGIKILGGSSLFLRRTGSLWG